MMELKVVGDVLGLTALAGCAVANLPQIGSILKNKNVDGISFNAYSIELYSLTIQVLYFVAQDYSFLAYGDLAILVLQDYVILGSIIAYGKESLDFKQYGNILGYMACMIALLTGTITKEMIVAVMQAVTFLNITSKLTFIGSILSTKDTSNMVPAGWLIFVYTNLVRLFTSYVLLGDPTLTFQAVINLSMNVIITAMIFKYREATSEGEKKKE